MELPTSEGEAAGRMTVVFPGFLLLLPKDNSLLFVWKASSPVAVSEDAWTTLAMPARSFMVCSSGLVNSTSGGTGLSSSRKGPLRRTDADRDGVGLRARGYCPIPPASKQARKKDSECAPNPTFRPVTYGGT